MASDGQLISALRGAFEYIMFFYKKERISSNPAIGCVFVFLRGVALVPFVGYDQRTPHPPFVEFLSVTPRRCLGSVSTEWAAVNSPLVACIRWGTLNSLTKGSP